MKEHKRQETAIPLLRGGPPPSLQTEEAGCVEIRNVGLILTFFLIFSIIFMK